METIEEASTITSKGQITLPKAIRQVLGLSAGSKVVAAGADLTRCAGFGLTRVRPMNALVSR